VRSRTHSLWIATGLTDSDLDLLEERLRPRINACSTVARPTRPDPEILTAITRHDATIGLGKSRHKSFRTSIASNRGKARQGEQIAGTFIRAHCESNRLDD
jgi:hypothetical protein